MLCCVVTVAILTTFSLGFLAEMAFELVLKVLPAPHSLERSQFAHRRCGIIAKRAIFAVIRFASRSIQENALKLSHCLQSAMHLAGNYLVKLICRANIRMAVGGSTGSPWKQCKRSYTIGKRMPSQFNGQCIADDDHNRQHVWTVIGSSRQANHLTHGAQNNSNGAAHNQSALLDLQGFASFTTHFVIYESHRWLHRRKRFTLLLGWFVVR